MVPLSLMFFGGGINHFIQQEFYLSMMPHYLPLHKELVWLSGIIEIFLGVAIWHKPFRKFAAYGMIALLIAVFPANVEMYLAPEKFPEIPEWALLARLPLQGLFIAWAFWYTRGFAR